MRENSRLLLEKAQRAIHAAKTLLAAGNLLDFATGRAYYAPGSTIKFQLLSIQATLHPKR